MPISCRNLDREESHLPENLVAEDLADLISAPEKEEREKAQATRRATTDGHASVHPEDAPVPEGEVVIERASSSIDVAPN
ncbi:MAG: hypothetical protein CM15mP49_27330 [Actinomycetota bacterium]|nr:MAG: hypothetical protein CM15mP49_27330 [Actinomycetota bacterium]